MYVGKTTYIGLMLLGGKKPEQLIKQGDISAEDVKRAEKQLRARGFRREGGHWRLRGAR